MVKRSRIRYPATVLLKLKQAQKNDLHKISDLTNEPINEIARRMIDRQIPLFLEHASRTKRLLNGETEQAA